MEFRVRFMGAVTGGYGEDQFETCPVELARDWDVESHARRWVFENYRNVTELEVELLTTKCAYCGREDHPIMDLGVCKGCWEHQAFPKNLTYWHWVTYGSLHNAIKFLQEVQEIHRDLEEIHKHTCPECKQSRHMDGCSRGESLNHV